MELGNFKDKRVGCLLFKKFNFINVDMSRHNYEFKRKKYYLQAMNKIEKKKSALEKLGHISSKFSKYIVSYSCDFTKHFWNFIAFKLRLKVNKNKPERVFGLQLRCREWDIFKTLGFFCEIVWKFLEIFGNFLVFFWNLCFEIFRGFFWRIFLEEFFGRNFLGGFF